MTVESGDPETETVKTNAVVPELPSFAEASAITTLHSKRRSWRWFLSPQPLPGFDVVVVVLVLDEELDDVVEVDERVLVEVLDELVDVEVVVGVVVEVVLVVVVVEQYWSCAGLVQYWYW